LREQSDFWRAVVEGKKANTGLALRGEGLQLSFEQGSGEPFDLDPQ
jgi:hypothetical protein